MIQLVGMLDSPYVRRVAVALLLAEVPFRHRPISLFRHIEAFSQVSPLLKAPTLVLDDGTALVESSVILEYLASLYPALADLAPVRAEAPIKAARAMGVALTVAEKAVQVHYERALRAPAERSESWGARIGRQLAVGLAALDGELPKSDWIGGKRIGLSDVAVACAWGFCQTTLGDLAEFVDPRRYPRITEFCDRAEDLKALRAAPPIDGVEAPVG
jgi:glutathione S-transferase